MATIKLPVESRDRAGKGTARATRRAGRTPAVIYGNKEEPIMISAETRAIRIQMHKPGFFTNLFELDLDGKKHRVLARDLQLHPVTDEPEHVDFLRVGKNTEITLEIPVEFINEEKCPGLKVGGVLNIARHEVEVTCLASEIPESIVVDLEGKELGEAVKISSVNLPKGVVPTITDRDFTIASVAAPSGLRSEAASEETEEEAAE